MAIESAAEIVQILAEEFRRSAIDPVTFAERAGIEIERLKLLSAGAWEELTIREIAAISQVLGIDLSTL